ncbi:type IV toxin-antitoxin system AbiEi family antitoxin domain-containing protein [Kocuria turfanensis]|uniref:AbiEi antitoxin N-terminal domain-containing protein n=1 Tax=Kocuria turfanensis TaxID=388357 RepID=A0A512IC31_9MICC|nr:type IV toxin-antitoxin system AbiEi family antitoxin domain-containing protein [Kocuria turfanensis]GEO95263.1 hypothetical protein KTU01_13860 [Kocuria turfanensis]
MTDVSHRLFSLAELEEAGISPASAQRAVRGGTLVRVVPGIYAPAPWWSRLRPGDRAYQMHVAVRRSARRAPVFCRDSAATVLGLRVLHRPLVPHVIQQIDHGSRNNRHVVHHWAELPPADVVEANGFRATSHARTALDCARFLPVPGALALVDHALRLGVSRQELLARCAALPGHRGVRRARVVLELADPRSESVGETLTRLVVVRAGLPPPELQVEVETDLGIFRPDFVWPQARLILEFDGLVTYSGAHGRADHVLIAERQREKALTNRGWRVLRTDWATVTGRPELLVSMLRRELARATAP